jgi:hypothetical protein
LWPLAVRAIPALNTAVITRKKVSDEMNFMSGKHIQTSAGLKRGVDPLLESPGRRFDHGSTASGPGEVLVLDPIHRRSEGPQRDEPRVSPIALPAGILHRGL